MRNHIGGVGGTSSEESEESEETDDMGDLVLELLTESLAPTTYNNYGTRMRGFHVFWQRRGHHPAKAKFFCYRGRHVAFTSWLARASTVAAGSLQPYFSSINNLFRDHLKEQVALRPLPTDARRGLAIQQQPITDPDIRIPIPAPIVQQVLHFVHR
jgi:hypothetical protein